MVACSRSASRSEARPRGSRPRRSWSALPTTDVAGIGGLLERIGAGLFQQAYVVADLLAAEHAMRATLGCGDFVNLPASDLEYELRGAQVSCALELGFARSGNTQIELLRPVRG